MIKLKDVIHFYIGCRAGREHEQDGKKFYEYASIVGVTKSEVEPDKTICIIDIGIDHFHEWYVEETKPILRRLEDMTDGEAERIILTLFDDVDDKIQSEELQINLVPGDGGLMVDQDMAVVIEVSCRCFEGQVAIRKCGSILVYDDSGELCRAHDTPIIFHQLLHKQFDIFKLIESGQAIDATKI